MTLTMQYPVVDFIHGPFHSCNGRFEVYFNPTHPGNVLGDNRGKALGQALRDVLGDVQGSRGDFIGDGLGYALVKS
jgi:hypothetical protein